LQHSAWATTEVDRTNAIQEKQEKGKKYVWNKDEPHQVRPLVARSRIGSNFWEKA